MLKMKKLSPQLDVRIWEYILKAGSSDLEYSQEKTTAVLKTIEKIERASMKTK